MTKTKMDRRFCKTCRFSVPSQVEVWEDYYSQRTIPHKKEYTTLYRCSNELFAKYNMVSGYKHPHPRCETLRDDSEKCGKVGREWTKQNKWVL